MLRRVQFEGDEYVPLAKRAYELWNQLERETGRALFTRTGLLIIGPASSQLIRGGRESARRHGVDHELLDARALRTRYPQHRVGDSDGALFDPEAGFISPEEAIAAAIIALARRLGLTTIAEGIETAAQLDQLAGLGCDFGQGFYLGRPAPGEDLRPSALPDGHQVRRPTLATLIA
jgi:glycine/D-amino acid oxidase-like deaminating enzyme